MARDDLKDELPEGYKWIALPEDVALSLDTLKQITDKSLLNACYSFIRGTAHLVIKQMKLQ